MPVRLYVDTSAILRAVLETGITPEIQTRLRHAEVLMTSRLAQVEAARALLRLRIAGATTEARLNEAEREVAAIWSRCELWELTAEVCSLACHVAPARSLRALDALHLATFLLARRRIEGLEMLTADERLREATEVA